MVYCQVVVQVEIVFVHDQEISVFGLKERRWARKNLVLVEVFYATE